MKQRHRITLNTLLAVALSYLPGFAQHAQTLAKADKAFTKKHYRRAQQLYVSDSSHLNDTQQDNLGYMYCTGKFGAGKDSLFSIHFIRSGAEKGNIKAMLRLGALLSDSSAQSTPNYSEALEWYHKAERAGSTEAWKGMSYLYREGKGVVKNDSIEFDYYKRAAEKGDSIAISCMGVAYNIGLFVKRDLEEAKKWYRMGIEKGVAEAMRNLGIVYANGDNITEHKKAMGLFKQAIKAGDVRAITEIGALYMEGKGIKTNYKKAMKLFRKGADKGDGFAMNNIGRMYKEGITVTKNYGEALSWFRKSAEAGCGNGMNEIGIMYLLGLGVPKDCIEALQWFRKGAVHNSAAAMGNVGVAYERGTCVTKDIEEAKKWYFKAGQFGIKKGEDAYNMLQK